MVHPIRAFLAHIVTNLKGARVRVGGIRAQAMRLCGREFLSFGQLRTNFGFRVLHL